jgi:two-component system phosphate regulon sensor histidine kinase PhoR
VFRSQCERLEQAEHSKAALEVRFKRNSDRHEQMETVVGALPEAVMIVDSADQIVFANPAAGRILGMDSFESLWERVPQILHHEPLAELAADLRRRKVQGQRAIELELAGVDGKSRWYGATARSLSGFDLRESSADDGVSHDDVLIVLRDISVLKSSNMRNAEFVSAVSHEMKTPLAGIKAYVELLADGDAADEQTREEFLQVINGQANRLQRLIDNLLNLARIEAGVVQVSKGSTSLNEMLDEAFELVRPAAEAKHIELVSDLSELFIGVLVDRDMIMQAAINLLSNAIKYTPDGGRVTLRSRAIDQQAVFEVEDTGVGLCEEDQVRVFEKFYRVKKDRDMASGTGLGLPLAKHIVEDVHGGQLKLASQLGQGSTFRVSIPAAAQMACHALN